MRHPIAALVGLSIFLGPQVGDARGRDLNERVIPGSGSVQVTAEIWVDNWFALYVNGQELIEDSTPYRTERSFNAESVTFSVDLPATIAFELRDFMEDDTGLEYIGSRRQQMGDGGAIFQFRAGSGRLLAVSDQSWSCLVVHHAPAEVSCARSRDPQVGEGACAADTTSISEDWTQPGFDASGWQPATIHSESDVRPKDGYDQVRWDPSAKLIWGENLEQDNIVLCRGTIE